MLKTLTTDHWHEVTEPHKHNQNSPWQTLTTVDTVCPFLNLAGKWGWNRFFFENWKIKCFLNFKNLSAEFSVTYFQEVVFLSVVVSVMCQIFSRWLKLNLLLIISISWLDAINAKGCFKSEKRLCVNNLQFSSNPNPALLVRCFEADQNIFFKKV